MPRVMEPQAGHKEPKAVQVEEAEEYYCWHVQMATEMKLSQQPLPQVLSVDFKGVQKRRHFRLKGEMNRLQTAAVM